MDNIRNNRLKKVFKRIRRNPWINFIGRHSIRMIGFFSKATANRLSSFWGVSGVVTLQFNDLSFEMFGRADDGIVDSFFYQATYFERSDLELFAALVPGKTSFADIGANTGLYSILASRINPHMSMVAVEPNPFNCNRLRKNLQLNQSSQVKVLEYALGKEEKTILFAVPDDDSISDVSSADLDFSRRMYHGEIKWKNIQVQQLTLDKTLSVHFPGGIELLKIDVENYEIPVFQGGKITIAKWKPEIICEIFLNDEKINYFNQFVHDCGLNIYTIGREGLSFLKQGFKPNDTGLNYFLTPHFYGNEVPINQFKSLRKH